MTCKKCIAKNSHDQNSQKNEMQLGAWPFGCVIQFHCKIDFYGIFVCGNWSFFEGLCLLNVKNHSGPRTSSALNVQTHRITRRKSLFVSGKNSLIISWMKNVAIDSNYFYGFVNFFMNWLMFVWDYTTRLARVEYENFNKRKIIVKIKKMCQVIC